MDQHIFYSGIKDLRANNRVSSARVLRSHLLKTIYLYLLCVKLSIYLYLLYFDNIINLFKVLFHT